MPATKKPKPAAKNPAPRGARKKPLAEDGYHPIEMLVGIGMGLGLTRKEMAALADVSLGSIDNRKQSDFAKFVAQKTKEAASRFIVETKEDLNQQFERRWGKAVEVLDEAMGATKADGSSDWGAKLRASEVVFDRTLGKATQKTEVVSDHTETHIYRLPEAVLKLIEQRTQQQLPEGDVIDVEEVIE